MFTTDKKKLGFNYQKSRIFSFWSRLGLILGATFLFIVIASPQAQAQSSLAPHVLVAANKNSANSMALANYYMTKRGVPRANLCLLDWDANDQADTAYVDDYFKKIAKPIYDQIGKLPQRTDYVVLCRNLPTKISFTKNFNDPNRWQNDMSVTSALASKTTNWKNQTNPYIQDPMTYPPPFNSKMYGMYLVTCLDARSWPDAFSLVDNALKAKPGGTFFFQQDPYRGGQYTAFNNLMMYAYNELRALKVPAQIASKTYVIPTQALGCYVSWGSDDSGSGRFSQAKYSALKFAPGSLVMTATSTDCINVRYPQPGMSNGGACWNQSQLAELIPHGATFLAGYVAEPTIANVHDPSVFTLSFVKHRNMAESFYAAAQCIAFKDLVIGDPLGNIDGN